MRKLYENFHILHFQKRIVSAETIRGNTVSTVLLIELSEYVIMSGYKIVAFRRALPFLLSSYVDGKTYCAQFHRYALLYKVASNSTDKNFVTIVYCNYL